MHEETGKPPYRREEWLRVTLSSIGDAVITTDVEGRVTFMNQAAQDLTGWTLAEATGVALDDVFKIVNEETRKTVENPATSALRDGLIVGLANHTVLIARDGTERPIDDSAAPIRDEAGGVVGVVLVFRDVTERRDAEHALRESEERFRTLVEGTRDYAIFMLDTNGTVASWNPGAERIKGYKADEIIGRHFSVFYPSESALAHWPERELEMATAIGRFEDEGWRLRKDGSRFWADVVITAIRDEAGVLRGFSKITRDLTERRAAEEALRSREERFRALAESANDAIVSADESGTVVFWNRAAVAIFGYDEEEVVGRPLAMLMPERYREAHEAGIRRLHAGGEPRIVGRSIEMHGRRKDGREFPVELSVSTWTTEEGRFYGGVLRDLTERKQLERATVAAELLAEHDRKKDEFLAMLSHELRNPLAPIRNAVHVLQLDADADPVRRQAREMIERQLGRLTRLVDDLLEVSRITTGTIRLRLERCDARDVVRQALEAARPLIDEQGHSLATSIPATPIWIDADPTRVEQIVVNIVANAVKFTDRGGKIAVAVAREGDECVVRVKDTGVGIAPDLLPQVFDLFTQAQRSLDRSQGGLGVGLTVVRRLAELHGGRVEAFSEGLGTGSEFVLRLPVAKAPESALRRPETPRAAAPSNAPLRILVVDDNRDAADSTTILLRMSGHEIRTAYSGRAALDAAHAFRPDAILLDIGLPEIDGYEIARRIRQDPALRNARLIAVTGYGQDLDREVSREAGFDAHLVKPVDPRNLLDALASPGP